MRETLDETRHAVWPGLSSVAPVWDDQGDGGDSGGSMEESSTMYAALPT